MAWIDDRIWCHPKFANLNAGAFALYIKGLAYSSGMNTGGRLDAGNQKLIGATKAARDQLIAARLWDVNGDGVTIDIHDWQEHNAKRDERRRKDRERKRAMRASAGHGADK
jgi:hypothetical protein